jgi:hypothetical protein
MIYFKTRAEQRKFKNSGKTIDLGPNPVMDRKNPKGLRWAIKLGL